MQIIDKMPSEQFEKVCDAGVDLVKELINVLNRFGLGQEHAAGVLAVASAGITKGSHLELDEFSEMISAIGPMWRQVVQSGQNGIVFDPAHRRPGFEPVQRNVELEN
jgi:hypothetical protein